MKYARRIKRWVKYLSLASTISVFCLSPVSAKPSESISESKIKQDFSNPVQLFDLKEIDPRIVQDIRYATTNNFLKKQVYPVSRCLLRQSVVEKLSKVQTELALKGLGLKVYDCYRPLSVQREMWKIKPDSNYVADPNMGGSKHNRASAVDLTLIDRAGKELEMPSGFDDFSEKSSLDYSGGSKAAQENRLLLTNTMKRNGFSPINTEWWHFDDVDWKNFPLLDIPLNESSFVLDRLTCATPKRVIQDSESPVNVREGPDTSFQAIGQLNNGVEICVLSEQNGWYKISVPPLAGWVAANRTRLIRP